MDINQLLQQAEKMKNAMEKSDAELRQKEYTNTVSKSQVQAVVNGDYRILSLKLDDAMVKSGDAEMIQDMVTVAINDCLEQIKADKENSIMGMAGDMGLPLGK